MSRWSCTLPFGRVGFARCVEVLQAGEGVVLLASTKVDDRLGRWSIACFEPEEVVTASAGAVVIRTAAGASEIATTDPLGLLQARARSRPPVVTGPDVPFTGGYAGFFGYELGRRLELPGGEHPDGAPTPDLALGRYARVLTLDHPRDTVILVADAVSGPALAARLSALAADPANDPPPPPNWAPRAATADFTPEAYAAAVERIREYIRAGDVYQVNLTQRLHAPIGDREPWPAFGALARATPAPFAAFLRFRGFCVASASPERFFSIADGHVETRPIKGTAPRGRDADEDARNLANLLASEKDLAELTMIVDLLRNDLGRVCRPGTVHVTGFPEPETYASVHHLVATVVGELAPGADVWDLLRATLPGGSITGAPKIRAMEIIDELEPVRRGVYTGCIGYLGDDGRADLNIAIRTAIFAGGEVHLHGGGGVVIDSAGAAEYAESILKLQKPLEALRFVLRGDGPVAG